MKIKPLVAELVPVLTKLALAPAVRADSEAKVMAWSKAAVRVVFTVPSPEEKVSAPRLWVSAPPAPMLSILKVPLPVKVSALALFSEPVAAFKVSVPALIVVAPV